MRYILTLLFFFIVITRLHSQPPMAGSRLLHFYDEKGQLLDSSNQERSQYKVYIGYVDYDGHSSSKTKRALSNTGTWGGYFDRSPMSFFIRIIRESDTMDVTIRHIFSRQFELDGIHFLKGNYETSFFSNRDSLLQLVRVENWWQYRKEENASYPRSMTISGTIIDATDGERLQNVGVRVKNSYLGVATNQQGVFKLNLKGHAAASADSVILEFSYVGYKPLQLVVYTKLLPVPASGGQPFQIQLERHSMSIGSSDVSYYLKKVAGYKNRYVLQRNYYMVD